MLRSFQSASFADLVDMCIKSSPRTVAFTSCCAKFGELLQQADNRKVSESSLHYLISEEFVTSNKLTTRGMHNKTHHIIQNVITYMYHATKLSTWKQIGHKTS